MNPSSTTPRTLAESASFVIAAVRALGINPDPESRLMQMHRVLAGATTFFEPTHPDFDTVREAERDMQLLSFVFDQSNAQSDKSDFQDLVKRMLHDSVLPQDDRGRSEGRDSQVELYIAAVCQNAGLVPIDYEEPDVTCVVDGVKFGIAAKRVKNLRHLYKRVKKAAQQIEAAQLPGIVALDTSIALNRDNKPIATPMPDHEFGPIYKQSMLLFVHDYHQKIYDRVDGKGVRGVVFHDHQVRLEPDGQWTLCGMTFWLPTAHDDEEANHEFSAFKNGYERGLPNLEIA